MLVPGRVGSIRDVLIDTAGVITGVAAYRFTARPGRRAAGRI
jgi:VanZ family protein